MTAQQINWLDLTTDEAPEDALVVVSGYNMGKPSRGRWIAVAHHVNGKFYSDETGEELAAVTHWHEIVFPESIGK